MPTDSGFIFLGFSSGTPVGLLRHGLRRFVADAAVENLVAAKIRIEVLGLFSVRARYRDRHGPIGCSYDEGFCKPGGFGRATSASHGFHWDS